MTSFQVKTTSCAVSGTPSLHNKLVCRWNVHVLLSDATSHLLARPGRGFWVVASEFKSPENMKRRMSRDDDSLAVMGLKVFGSAKVETVSRPPKMPGWGRLVAAGSGLMLAGVSFLLPQPDSRPTAKIPRAKRRTVRKAFMANQYTFA